MSCKEFQVLLTDYLDGTLDKGTTSRFAAHALRCRRCRAVLDDVKAKLRDDPEQEDLETALGLRASLERIPSGYSSLECSRFEEIITEFLDGFVPAPVYHRFGAHSAECDRCSRLLTDVVYAVAACHSVHTYEELEVPDSLSRRLTMVGQPSSDTASLRSQFSAQKRLRRIALKAARLKNAPAFVFARETLATVPSRLAGASALAFASLLWLVFGFSDDRTLGGIYRQARVKAAEIYTRGIDFYSRKDEVAASVERVGSDLDEIWVTIGGPANPQDAWETRGLQAGGNNSVRRRADKGLQKEKH